MADEQAHISLVLAGDFQELAERAIAEGVSCVLVKTKEQLFDVARGAESIRIVVMPFFMPSQAAIDLIPELRILLPNTVLLISNLLYDGRLPSATAAPQFCCDRYVPYPLEWEVLAEML